MRVTTLWRRMEAHTASLRFVISIAVRRWREVTFPVCVKNSFFLQKFRPFHKNITTKIEATFFASSIVSACEWNKFSQTDESRIDRIVVLFACFVLFEGPRSFILRDINKLFFSLLRGRIFLRFSTLLRRGRCYCLSTRGVSIPQRAGSWGISLGIARAITLAVFLTVAQGVDAIYDFVWRCNNPSKPPSGGPNPELRGPGNDLVNRHNDIVISRSATTRNAARYGVKLIINEFVIRNARVIAFVRLYSV